MTESRVLGVVLNWHDEVRTMTCVRSLLQDGGVARVLVVDNDARGDMQEIVRAEAAELPISVIEIGENRGFAGGVNCAIRSPEFREYDYAVFINNDAYAMVGALAELVKTLDTHLRVDLVSPVVLNIDGSVQSAGSTLRRLDAKVSDNLHRGAAPDFLSWACVMARVDLFARVGALDEAFFMYWEDVEFSLRLTRLGREYTVCDQSYVVHEGSASRSRAGTALDTYYAMGLWRIAPHLGRGGRCRVILRSAEILIWGLVRLRFRSVAAVVRGLRLGMRSPKTAYEMLQARD